MGEKKINLLLFVNLFVSGDLNKSFLFGQKWGKFFVQYGTLKGFFFAKKFFKKWSLNKKGFLIFLFKDHFSEQIF